MKTALSMILVCCFVGSSFALGTFDSAESDKSGTVTVSGSFPSSGYEVKIIPRTDGGKAIAGQYHVLVKSGGTGVTVIVPWKATIKNCTKDINGDVTIHGRNKSVTIHFDR